MSILLLGGTGQLGWELQRSLAILDQVIAPSRAELDLANLEDLCDTIRKIRPNWIVNAAAYTAVDKAESEREQAFVVNADVPRVLAQVASDLGAVLVHYSTDYVFDGSGNIPVSEDAPPNPLNIYGKSKFAGELAIVENHPQHLIFRTSWIYSTRGTNFLLTMRRVMQEKTELRIVNDQIGSPTWSRHLAEATAQILAQIRSPQRGNHVEPWGIYHVTNSGETSWFGFAQAICASLNLQRPPRLLPIPSLEYPTPAVRPLNSRLCNDKLKQVFGLQLPDWQLALAQACQ